MEQIIELLRKSADAYYNSDMLYEATQEEIQAVSDELGIPCQTLITDQMFDEIYYRAKQQYPNNPYFLSVGSEVRGEKVKLPEPMGSMVECKSGELANWLCPNSLYVVSEKLDGNSALLVYDNGRLKIAYSRGNGIEGQDITRHIKKFENSLPSLLNDDGTLYTGTVRGEIIVPKSDIQPMINSLKEETGKVYKNGRNTVAGQLNSKECADAFTKYAHFVAYKISGYDDLSEQERFAKLAKLGFLTPAICVVSPNLMDENDFVKIVKDVKTTGKYECDGIIITQDMVLSGYEGFETSSLNPKCSRKFKVGAIDNVAITEVEYIEWNVSKDGYFKPRVKVKPVDIQGVTIDWATGHNYGNVINQKICRGAKIQLKRSGDVIPYIEKVIETPEIKDYTLPNESLYEQVLSEDGSVVDIELVYETTTDDNVVSEFKRLFSEKCLQQLVYFCQKMGVEFAGEGNIRKLMAETENPSMAVKNLLSLPMSVFEKSIGVNGLKFYNSLHKVMKTVSVCKFMDATGTFGRGIGELKLQKIFDKYGALPYDSIQILVVDGWAQKMVDQYMNKYCYYLDWTDWLFKHYNEFVFYEDKPVITGDKCQGLNVVFTGVRSAEMEDVIRSNGGKVLSSMTKECNLVIAKDPMGYSGKLQKARDKGIEIISLDEAFERFGHMVKNKSIDMDNPLLKFVM